MIAVKTIDVSGHRDSRGNLYTPSHRFGVHCLLANGHMLSSLSYKLLSEALAEANDWAAAKPGQTAVVFRRADGKVMHEAGRKRPDDQAAAAPQAEPPAESLYETAKGALNVLCGILNRTGHRLGQDPESPIERAIAATAQVADNFREQGK